MTDEYEAGWYQANRFPINTDADFDPYYFDGSLWWEANADGFQQVDAHDFGPFKRLIPETKS